MAKCPLIFTARDIFPGVMDAPAHALRCLKADGLHNVWLIQPPGQSMRTLKTWPLGVGMLFKLWLGIAQPQRQLRGMRRLRRINVPTPNSFGPWRLRRRGKHWMVELEMDFAPGQSAWELISNERAAPAKPHDLIRAARKVGQTVAALTGGRAFHRDLKPSNVVIDFDQHAKPAVWIIDTVGVRRMRNRIAETERMLERLAIQPMQLEPSLARKIRIAVLRATLEPLSLQDRRDVLSRLRLRVPNPHGRSRTRK